ncbi:hypothetical protein MLD38_015555 [Melastoma candidum]|uniref:Uncharacterized protein n=1 Tax=Melastoma candidum TaxID=119954 RepID=A0ACB9RHN7_9MYRT|nr:hypothetical protein MLD38_015555 [Melastoma candidum]
MTLAHDPLFPVTTALDRTWDNTHKDMTREPVFPGCPCRTAQSDEETGGSNFALASFPIQPPSQSTSRPSPTFGRTKDRGIDDHGLL